jgi:hypothetical protein
MLAANQRLHGLMYPMRVKAATNAVTDKPNRITEHMNIGVVFRRNASLHPSDVALSFSRILLSTSTKDDHATTVMAAIKL